MEIGWWVKLEDKKRPYFWASKRDSPVNTYIIQKSKANFRLRTTRQCRIFKYREANSEKWSTNDLLNINKLYIYKFVCGGRPVWPWHNSIWRNWEDVCETDVFPTIVCFNTDSKPQSWRKYVQKHQLRKTKAKMARTLQSGLRRFVNIFSCCRRKEGIASIWACRVCCWLKRVKQSFIRLKSVQNQVTQKS